MNTKILKIVLVGLMAGLCYISFMFLQIKIPTPGGFTSDYSHVKALVVADICTTSIA